MKNVLSHMNGCQAGKTCPVPHCASSRLIVSLWKNCIRQDCPVCEVLKIKPRHVIGGQGPRQPSHVGRPGNTQHQQQTAQHSQRSLISGGNNLPQIIVASTAVGIPVSEAPAMQNDGQRMRPHGAFKRGLDGEIRVCDSMVQGSVGAKVRDIPQKDSQIQMMGLDVPTMHRTRKLSQIPQQHPFQESPKPPMSSGRSFPVTQGKAASLVNIPTQPGQLDNIGDVAAYHSEGNKDWHQSITSELRNHFVQSLVQAVVPRPDSLIVQDIRFQKLVGWAHRVESDMFNAAKSRPEYYHLTAEKIYKIKMEIEQKGLQRRPHLYDVSQPAVDSSHQQQHQHQQKSIGTSVVIGAHSYDGTIFGPGGSSPPVMPNQAPTQQHQMGRFGPGLLLKSLNGNGGGMIRGAGPSGLFLPSSLNSSGAMTSPTPITHPSTMASANNSQSSAYSMPPSGPMVGLRCSAPTPYISPKTSTHHKLPKPNASSNGLGLTHMQQVPQQQNNNSVSEPIFSQHQSTPNTSASMSMNPTSGADQFIVNASMPSRICHSVGNAQMKPQRTVSSNMSSREDVKPDLNNLSLKQEKLDVDVKQEIRPNEANQKVLSSHDANNIKMELKIEFKEESNDNSFNPTPMNTNISSVKSEPGANRKSNISSVKKEL